MGKLLSVAHYAEQNDDLMRDPEMVFILGKDDEFYPVSIQQDFIGEDWKLEEPETISVPGPKNLYNELFPRSGCLKFGRFEVGLEKRIQFDFPAS